MNYLSASIAPKSDRSNFIRMQNIENAVRDALMIQKVPVEEYCEFKLTKQGFPGDYRDFLDICIGESIPPTVFAVVANGDSEIEASFIKESKIYKCKFHDDDLLSNLFSLCNSNNCIEILFNNPSFERIFDGWGITCVKSGYRSSEEMIKKYMKVEFQVVDFVKEDCCMVNMADFDLVDLGLQTQQGKRLLNQWLRTPLLKQSEIERRLDLVEAFEKINISVDRFVDLKRIIARIYNKTITMQEVVKLARTLEHLNGLLDSFKGSASEITNLITTSFIAPFEDLKSIFYPIIQQIKNTLDFSNARIHTSLSTDLEKLESSKFELLAEVEAEFLRVKKDYPRVSFSNKHFKISRLDYNQSEFDLRKYVLTSILKTGVLFLTKNLADLNEKISLIDDQIKKTESQIFTSLITVLLQFTPSFETYNYLIALIDIYKAFSLKVSSDLYSRPKFNGSIYKIEDMHHPLLEHRGYILNSVEFTNSVCVLTGPNMGGKSTFLRTLGIISLYAQIGCYVPTRSAILPIFDKIFLRIGARDCTSQKLSTFMIEMNDLNKILRGSTSQSLILIDELGRGTSAIDGLSLSIAVRDYLNNLNAKTVMATHFSELGSDTTMNKKMSIENNILMYKVVDGVCDLSFGINVAKIARFPEEVIVEAERYLQNNDILHDNIV